MYVYCTPDICISVFVRYRFPGVHIRCAAVYSISLSRQKVVCFLAASMYVASNTIKPFLHFYFSRSQRRKRGSRNTSKNVYICGVNSVDRFQREWRVKLLLCITAADRTRQELRRGDGHRIARRPAFTKTRRIDRHERPRRPRYRPTAKSFNRTFFFFFFLARRKTRKFCRYFGPRVKIHISALSVSKAEIQTLRSIYYYLLSLAYDEPIRSDRPELRGTIP